MRTQGTENVPDNRETLVVVERRRGIDSRRYSDREDDVAVLLTRGLAHRTTNCLHNVHGRTPRTHEQHRIQGGHIDAFREAAGVGQDTAPFRGFALQPLDACLAFKRMILPVDMPGLAPKRT